MRITALGGPLSRLIIMTSALVTLTATANAQEVSKISLDPSTVVGGAPSFALVTLSKAAPKGGFQVTLSSGTSAATVPASVTVDAGKKSATVLVKTTSVTAVTTAAIEASGGGGSASATLTINTAKLIGFIIAPPSVTGGASATGAVALDGPAPTGGITVAVSSDESYATVPSTVTIDAGKIGATFKIATTPVTANSSAHISASYGTAKFTELLKVLAPHALSLAIAPSEVFGGELGIGLVHLDQPAGTSGATVTLSSDSTFATVPASVKVKSGDSSALFTVATTAVTAQGTATITATANGSSKTATIKVDPSKLATILITPESVKGGDNATADVDLFGIAPAGGLTVTLSSSSSDATAPATIVVPAGKSHVTFTIATTKVTANVTATVSATLGSVTKKATIEIKKS